MIEYYLRPRLQRWLIDPCAKQLNHYHPNSITLLGLAFGVLSGAALVLDHPIAAVCLLLLSGFTDILDGTVARLQQSTSPKGAVLDIVSDRVVEISLMIALFALAPDQRAIEVIAMISATFLCVTVFLVIGIFCHNDSQKSFHYNRGLMERPEAFVFYGLMIVMPAHFAWLSWGYTLLVSLTFVQHLAHFLLAKKSPE